MMEEAQSLVQEMRTRSCSSQRDHAGTEQQEVHKRERFLMSGGNICRNGGGIYGDVGMGQNVFWFYFINRRLCHYINQEKLFFWFELSNSDVVIFNYSSQF